MTRKQYEHIGRAVECVIRLNAMSERMDDDRKELSKHLDAIVHDGDAVDTFVRRNYGVTMASWLMPERFFSSIADAIAKENTKR